MPIYRDNWTSFFQFNTNSHFPSILHCWSIKTTFLLHPESGYMISRLASAFSLFFFHSISHPSPNFHSKVCWTPAVAAAITGPGLSASTPTRTGQKKTLISSSR